MLKITAIVNLGNDAILNVVNGKQVINFNAAHTEKYKNQQGVETTKTQWISCSYWTDKTGIVPYLRKGTQIFLEGQPEIKTYTDKENKLQPQLTVRINQIQLLGSKPQEKTSDIQTPNIPESFSTNEDNLPF